jgi:hypothetical protein
MPSSNKTHVSAAVPADLGKLSKHDRAEIRRVAGMDMAASAIAGADTRVKAVDMARKVLPTARVSGPGINREPPPIEAKKTGKA